MESGSAIACSFTRVYTEASVDPLKSFPRANEAASGKGSHLQSYIAPYANGTRYAAP
jgi:hypothetical protein